MDYTHLPRTIKEPYWSSEIKDQVICQFHYEGGPMIVAAVSDTEKGNPDWKEIMETFTEEEINKNTKKYGDEHKRRKEAAIAAKKRKEKIQDIILKTILAIMITALCAGVVTVLALIAKKKGII